MPRITRPSRPVISAGPKLSQSAPSVDPGGVTQAVNALGRSLTREGARVAELADQAYKNALFTEKLSEASEQLNKRYTDRVSITHDDEGRPTFNSLVEDVGKAGSEVLDEVLSTVPDTEVRSQLFNQFSRFITNKKISAQGVARSQKIQAAKSSLHNGVNSLISQAVSDSPENTEKYLASITSAISSARNSGVITPLQADSMMQNSRSEISKKSILNLIDRDPVQAIELLSGTDNKALGISEFSFKSLVTQAKKREEEAKLQSEVQAVSEKHREDEDKILRASQMSLLIQEGSLGQSDIEQAFSEGKISPTQKESLDREVQAVQIRKARELEDTAEIDQTLKSNAPSIDILPSKITGHYKKTLESLRDPETGSLPDLKQRAVVASGYSSPVRPFASEVSTLVLSEDPQQAIEAIEAFNFVVNKNPIAMAQSSIKKDARAIISTYTTLVEGTNVEPQEALRIARTSTLAVDEEENKRRVREFRKIDGFTSDVRDTILDLHDDFRLGFIDLPGGEADHVPDEVVRTFRTLLSEGYQATGDESATLEMVRAQTKGLYGISEVNGRKEIMMLPPETILGGVSPEEIRQDLTGDLANTNLPAGVIADQVKIKTDNLSRRSEGNLTYMLYYEDRFGNPVPLRDSKSGELLRWSPNVKSIRDARIEKELKEAERKRALELEASKRLFRPGRQGKSFLF